MRSEEDCRRISCCDASEGNFSAFTYSLVSGFSYNNEEMTITVDCPPGFNCSGPTITIPIPPGGINFIPVDIDPNPPGPGNPNLPEAGTYTFNCGANTLVITLAPGENFSAAQITQILNFLASCQAIPEIVTGLQPTPNNVSFTNDAVYASCSATGSQLTATGAIPGWIIIEVNANGNRLAARPGTFSRDSLLLANTAAQSALNMFLAESLLSGLLVCSCFINGSSMPEATLDEPYAATFLPSSGMSGVFTVINGALPPGLTLNSTTGQLAGTPTVAGNYSFEIAFSPNP